MEDGDVLAADVGSVSEERWRSAMRTHAASETVCHRACGALLNIAHGSDALRQAIVDAGGPSCANNADLCTSPSYGEILNEHCPVTCGVCRDQCKDQHDDCPGWAREGECVNNPGHTLKTCPTSCGVEACKADTGCADKNATACAIWALDDECLSRTRVGPGWRRRTGRAATL